MSDNQQPVPQMSVDGTNGHSPAASSPGKRDSQNTGFASIFDQRTGSKSADSAYFEELKWNDIKMTINIPENSQKKGPPCGPKKLVPKQILKGISGACKKGRLMAVMGPSGSGKTTLLNILAARKNDAAYEGDVLIDNVKVDDATKTTYQKKCGFVQQRDLFMGTNTVYEHLDFQAKLLKVSDEQVDAIMALLRIKGIKDSLIGAEEGLIGKGISGGEMKRLSIASELLRNPYFLLADEPTSGLDSALAEDVIEIMKEIAYVSDRICLSTIHQPSSAIYNLFDDVVLLCEGHCVYYGTRLGAVEYFEKLGYPIPPFTNPADHWLRILTVRDDHAEDRERVDKILNFLVLS